MGEGEWSRGAAYPGRRSFLTGPGLFSFILSGFRFASARDWTAPGIEVNGKLADCKLQTSRMGAKEKRQKRQAQSKSFASPEESVPLAQQLATACERLVTFWFAPAKNYGTL